MQVTLRMMTIDQPVSILNLKQSAPLVFNIRTWKYSARARPKDAEEKENGWGSSRSKGCNTCRKRKKGVNGSTHQAVLDGEPQLTRATPTSATKRGQHVASAGGPVLSVPVTTARAPLST